ncbi:MAG: PAS domain S-box protein [Acidobacteriia bacterium]|nr:PAS domain S-box protein [Terriglobia bacterium]
MKELKSQLVSALLVILTAAGLISAGINFQQQKKFQLPEDGVTWVDRSDSSQRPIVVALDIVPASPAERAGVKVGDVLTKINNALIRSSIDSTMALARLGAYKTAEYTLERGGIEFKAKVIIRESESALYYQYAVGMLYLAIGLFVYLRRARAPRATHFYVLCLASFVLSCFHYTGKLNNFDKVIYWGNVVAGLLAPTIFLHFSLTFPEPRRWLQSRWRVALLYLPAAIFTAIYLGFASGTLRTAVPLLELRWLLDRAWLLFLSTMYLLGALALTVGFRRTEDAIVRQQMKWLRNGAILGVVPFTCIYTIPYVVGVVPGPYMNLAVLSLALIPITWAYAILRYRLMDVDVIFQQGYAYTLATLAVLGIFYALILVTRPLGEMDPSAVVLLILIAAFVFQPIHNWLQEQLDRYWFYKDRYDYRRTLVEFARELSSETNLDAMLHSVADRIRGTLYTENVAFFLSAEAHRAPGEFSSPAGNADRFELTMYSGAGSRLALVDRLDLSFLTRDHTEPLFFERTRHRLDILSHDQPATVRHSVARLDLTYYLPCSVRGRTIAYLGVSRPSQGDFLSSEDLELLATLSNYVGIAIENARLYTSLAEKMAEYERLKEFSENIVESINVGIVAAGLDDQVESWNSQMETLTGISRETASGQRLSDLFPHRLSQALEEVRSLTGVHQIYKLPVRARSWRDVAAEAASAAGGSNGVPQTASERLVNVAVAPLFTKDQEKIGRLIIFDDVTERAELEQQLVRADRLSSIGLLAAGVAHEVNTPLAVISTYAQMLTKQISGDDPKSKLLEKIAKQTFRASEIVNSLLNFSRTSRTEFEEIQLNRVVRETLGLVEHQLEKGQVRVELRIEEDLPAIRGNFGKMQQVFLNLFINARDAMENGGVLSVTTRYHEGLAMVEVSDTGKGIPPSELSRIYDPFFTTKPPKKGTGLGLSVSYGIVREHSGAIDVDSRPGEGTVFRLEFPAVRKPVHV